MGIRLQLRILVLTSCISLHRRLGLLRLSRVKNQHLRRLRQRQELGRLPTIGVALEGSACGEVRQCSSPGHPTKTAGPSA
jgi:hypothetical protein